MTTARQQLDATRTKRAAAEADEIAARVAYQRSTVTRPTDSDQMLSISGIPEARTEKYDDAGDFDGPPIIAVLLIVMIILFTGFAFGWLIGHMDARTAWDFIAPTAAQARDIGASNLIERF